MLRKWLFFFVLILSAVNGFSVQSDNFRIIEKSSEAMLIEWQAPELVWENVVLNGASFLRPHMGTLLLNQDADKPGLPLDAFCLDVPPGLHARVLALDSVYTEQTIAHAPLPGRVTDADAVVNSVPGYYPNCFIRQETGSIKGQNRLRIQITPIQYNELGQRMRVLSYARLQIVFAAQTGLRKTAAHAPIWQPDAGRSVKLALVDSGLYEISGTALQTAGVYLANINPDELKLYYQGQEQPLSVLSDQAGRLSTGDRIRFYAERRHGDAEYFNAYSDTNIYWLTWMPGPGLRYRPEPADTSAILLDHLPGHLHLEKDVAYYSGDTDTDIHDTEKVSGEGWVWNIINRNGSFSFSFDLLNAYEYQDSVSVRLRLRGTTLDSHTPDHHVQIYLNQTKVKDFYFSDREEVQPVFKVPAALLKARDNSMEIRSLADTEAERSQFYLDWVDLYFQQRCSAINASYLYDGADVDPAQALFVDGFATPAISVWDLDNGYTLTGAQTGAFFRAAVQVRSAGLVDGNQALFFLNSEEIYRGNRGHNLVALDGVTGQVLVKRNFDTYGSQAQSDSLAAFLQRLPNQTIVLLAVADDGSSSLTANAKNAIIALGGSNAGQLKFRDSYALIARKGGSADQAIEMWRSQGQGAARADAAFTFTGANQYGVRFSRRPGSAGRTAVFDSTAYKTPLSMTVYQGEDLASSDLSADYIVITHAQFLPAAQQIAAYRQSRNGMRTHIALIDDIYDSFSYGLKSPHAIKEFLRYAWQNWVRPAPAYVLLIGDASTDPKYLYGRLGQNDFVPTYGNPVSDLWFVCLDDSADYLPEMSIGRWPVETLAQAEAAVQKTVEYESTPSAEWKKEFLFISGGFTYLEQSSFRGQSNNLHNDFVKPAPLCGHSEMIQKTSLDFREGENRPEIMAALNSGKVWTNFIGHAASRTWDMMFHNADIDLLDNAPRYSFITSMTCHTGRFAQPDQVSFGENFILAPGRGAIAFLGTSGWGYTYEDYLFLRRLFPAAAKDTVRIIGRIVDQAKSALWDAYGSSRNIRDMALQYNLLGDPAVALALPTQPDLALTPDDLQISPENPSEADSIATVRLRIRNYGLATVDSIQVTLASQHPVVGCTEIASLRRPAIGRRDSLTVQWPLRQMAGAVGVKARLDELNAVEEADENNNELTKQVAVLSSRVVLIAPQDHSVSPYNQTVLKIQNPQIGGFNNQFFEFQIDTTCSFNSKLLQRSGPVSSGILATSWSSGILLPGQNYCWSVHNRVDGAEHYSLSGRFYSGGVAEYGWRQEAEQMPDNPFLQHVEVEEHELRLHKRTLPLLVQSAGFTAGHYAIIDMMGEPLMTTGRGYNVVVMDRKTARVVTTRRFDVYGDATAATDMAQLLNSLTSGELVLMAVSDDGAINMNETAFAALEALGSTQIRKMQFRDSWAFISFRGATPGEVKEKYMPGSGSAIREAVVQDTLRLFSEQGEIHTAAIGPVKQWGLLSMNASAPDSTQIELSVWGRNSSTGNIDTLLSRSMLMSVDLADVPADRYPTLQLGARLQTKDGHVTPVLHDWQMQFLPAPDLAVGPAVFKQSRDSLLIGGTLSLELSLYNIGTQPADSCLISFQESDPIIGYRTFAVVRRTVPLAPDSSWIVRQTWTASGKAGMRQLLISVDPLHHINEVIETNNTITTNVRVLADTVKPDILVTFDAREIISGDLVASQPRILISLRDNSPQALQDSSRVSLWLDGKRIFFGNNSAILQWQPAPVGVSALLEYTPTLRDGDHYFEVIVKDPSGNTSTRHEEFTVEADLKIMQLLNYPNPFSDHTDITFMLTQPAQISIKIFTVAGRMIRELADDVSAAGFIIIPWDGRDADGDRLANGVYLYKVVARIDNEKVEEIGKALVIR